MKQIIKNAKARAAGFLKDARGSETVEFVASAAICCFIIMTCLLILGYALQCDALTHSGKQIARAIEVTGTAREDQLSDLVYELIPNASKIGVSYTVTPLTKDGVPSNAWHSASGRRIQLRDRFKLELRASYQVPVAATGSEVVYLTLPIYVRVDGQSEIYWKTS